MARTYLLNNSAPPKETQNNAGSSSKLPGLSPDRALLGLSAPATASANTTSFLELATQTAQATPLAPSDRLAPSERAAPSTNMLSTPLVPSNRTAPPTNTLPPATHLHQPAIPLTQPLSNNYAAQGSNSLMLMGLDEIDQLEMEPAYLPDQGIAPSEVFSQAPSTALELNQSTPVSHPVERQHFAVLRREVLPPSMAGSMTPTPTHRLAPMNESQRRDMLIDPLPYNQVALRGREMLVDTVMTTQEELTTMSNIFQGQWLLFVNVKETNNYRLMRIALNQAMSTQDTIKSLFGTEKMMSVSDRWLACDELARLEHSLQIPPQPVAEPPTARPQPHLAMQVDRPPSTYQACMPPLEHQVLRAPAAQQQHQRLPPPPPPPAVKAPCQANELMAPPPVPGQMIPSTGRRPEIHQPAAQRPYPPPPYPEEEGYYAQEQFNPQLQHPHQAYSQYAPYPANGNQAASHPYPRNCCRSNPMTRMLQVGNFFMRAERVMNRMQRHRTRGGRDNQMPPLAQLPPGNPH
ncbi:hypothetical protein PCANC_19171 [Puccinia coronata f. sp. avenae]|uniref:Uncharacterized protein n=1 Tax=Puccinia coronata f. sp. avenae TaxID=200324 RepID=A0A2N5U2F2_9BASI|nr:hypothetical protein PCANC_19171 [Puccinia coronata f. sp. avenae]